MISQNSNTLEFLTTSSPPSIFDTTNVTSTSFRIEWNQPIGATSYAIDVSLNSNFSNFVTGYQNRIINTRNITISNLSVGIPYYIRVRSINSNGFYSIYSITYIQYTLPAIPNGLSISSITDDGFNLSWNLTPGAISYRVDISTDSNFDNFIPGYNNQTVTTRNIDINNLNSNTTYYIRVRSSNFAGETLLLGIKIFYSLSNNF
jgi:hypothetical protein